jgi:oxygen-independent coproporphyrinogen-3 oxidase
MSEYVNCIEKELLFYQIDFKEHTLQNIYFGGGTPTLLNKENWIKLFKIIHKFFKVDKNAQILIEGTPETCTYPKLKLLKDLGMNRLTIGAQTFDEKILNSLNRRHSISDIYKAFKNARKAGIKYLNIDLLFGLPGETKKSFLNTLNRAIEIKPECISPAFLDLNERVSFAIESLKNIYVNKEIEGREAEAFSEIRRILKENEYYDEANGMHYSSFLLRGDTQAYNQNNIPKGSPHSTVVMGCHGDGYLNYFKNRPYQLQYHAGRLNRYISELKSNRMPNFLGLELSEDEIIRQYLIYCCIFLHERINKKDFLNRFNKDIITVLETKFPKLLRDYKIKENKDTVYFRRKKPYLHTNRDKFVLFCMKYLYSPKVLKSIEKEVKDVME